MNRLTKAWKALRGTLEPEVVREVDTKVEKVYLPAPDGWLNVYSVCVGRERSWNPDYEHFATCAQAHATHVGKEVRCNVAAVVGGRAFIVRRLEPIEIQPKPKRPKGKATA